MLGEVSQQDVCNEWMSLDVWPLLIQHRVGGAVEERLLAVARTY
jgi:hypothetical protein